jgi:hypothetical protein
LRKLRAATIFRHTQHPTGGRDLNKIGTIFIALAYGFARIVRAIDYTFLRSRDRPSNLCVLPLGGIAMTTRSGHMPLPAVKILGPTIVPALTALRKRNVNTRATAIAHRGEPSQQISARIDGSLKSNIRFVLRIAFYQTILAGFAFNVHVHINQPGHYCFFAEVDYFIVFTWFGETFVNTEIILFPSTTMVT